MGSNGSDEVVISGGDEGECSETTVEIKIKTLDSQTYTLRVNKRMPVPELKDQIATVTGVLSEQQRLICRGKVMKDDQLLSAYHVENGHTLHMVVRQPLPPSSESTVGSMASENLLDNPATDPASGTGQNRGNRVGHTVVLETFNLGDQVDGGMPDLNRIVSAVLSSIGITGIGSGSEGVDLREPGSERLDGMSGATGMSDSTQPLHDIPTTRVQFDPLHGPFRRPTAASLGSLQPPVIPDSLTTLSQYLSHLRHEFSSNAGSGQSNYAVDASMRGSQEREHSGAGQGGLPTPASLAEVMLSTRRLLIEEAGGCLYELARQLEDQANVTTPALRSSIQTNALRSGVLLQNLGALILELGRATMTLRMGQTPSEAVVNAGPAVFISTSGPNPIMVQPLPFQPGLGFGATPMGNVNPGSGFIGGTLGSGFFPRNIDIRIRTGPSMSSGNINQGEQAGAAQTPGQTGATRGSGNSSFVHQVATGVAGGPSLTGESGVRMVPVRTVVAAVPAAVSLLARVQQLNNTRNSQTSDERLPSIPETNRQPVPDSAVQQQNIGSSTGVPMRDGTLPTPNSTEHEGPDSNTNNTGSVAGTQNGQESTRQIPGISEQLLRTLFPGEQIRLGDIDFQVLPRESTTAQGGTTGVADTDEAVPRLGIEEGIFLSGLLHQIMPYISQISVPEPNGASAERVDTFENGMAQHSSTQTEENPDDVGTSQPCNCPPPNSKRQKRE